MKCECPPSVLVAERERYLRSGSRYYGGGGRVDDLPTYYSGAALLALEAITTPREPVNLARLLLRSHIEHSIIVAGGGRRGLGREPIPVPASSGRVVCNEMRFTSRGEFRKAKWSAVWMRRERGGGIYVLSIEVTNLPE
jgi:hypothetical protein